MAADFVSRQYFDGAKGPTVTLILHFFGTVRSLFLGSLNCMCRWSAFLQVKNKQFTVAMKTNFYFWIPWQPENLWAYISLPLREILDIISYHPGQMEL